MTHILAFESVEEACFLPPQNLISPPWTSISSPKVLFVRVCVPVNVATVSSILNVTTSVPTVVVIPVPPVNVRFSDNNCIAVLEPESPATVKVVAIS